MGLYIANSMIGLLHTFLISEFMCKILKLKYARWKSLSFCWTGIFIFSSFINYCVSIYWLKVLIGVTNVVLIALMISEEKIIVKIVKGILGYFFFTALDIFCAFIIIPWYFPDGVLSLEITPNLVLSRMIYGMIVYLILIIVEMVANWRKSFLFFLISCLFITLGMAEMLILYNVCLGNQAGLKENFIILAVVCSASIMLQYFVSIDIFHHVILQNQRDAELEQIKQERNYQYEYYLSAYQQNEQLRDMRHDMRNYLQTIQFLMEDDMDQKKAEQMIQELLQKFKNNDTNG